jgi:hypothetical protein
LTNQPRSSLKIWRDELLGYDYARLDTPGKYEIFTRPSTTIIGSTKTPVRLSRWNGGDWKSASVRETGLDRIPVVALVRHRPFLEPAYETIDQITQSKFERLITSATQIFRQRAIMGDLPETDQQGNAIDYSKVFDTDPGSIWQLPVDINIWESQQTDIRQFIDQEKHDLKVFSALTKTPLPILLPDGANQSSEGVRGAFASQIQQAENDILRIKPLMGQIFQIYTDIKDVEVIFEKPELISMAERLDMATKARTLELSSEIIQRDYLGWSKEQIDEEAVNQAGGSYK